MMKKFLHIMLKAAICAVLLGNSAVWGQYLLNRPLQIGLQLRSPARPSSAIYPYGYGSNLIVSGNVRYGKSFQGVSSLQQIDRLFSQSLPTTGLDTFRRDSVSITDILGG
ncbi:MAG: hypothetical protein QF662_07040, partial [Phycisphaerae bacterium]|nr:hypothetical protein [Phycisphaerae bacterium]